MALPPLAEVEDLAGWLGVEISDETRAEAILAAASTLVRSYSGRVWVEEDGAAEEGLTEVQSHAAHVVTLSVAARVWRNPAGTTQQTTGPFSHSVAAWAALGLALTEDEKAMIGAGSGGIPGLSSVRVEAPVHASASRLLDRWWEEDEEV